MTDAVWASATDHAGLTALVQDKTWDLVIAGGGITGAGVAREAARTGLNVLLVERQDFSWGTSSRSSKMVHGGLRYIAQGDVRTTMHSVHERERLMREAPGLVDLMPYMMPHYRGRFPGPFMFGLLLRVYDFLARKRYRRFWSSGEIRKRFPFLRSEDLKGVTEFADAVTDDSRLVMRVLHEARQDGAVVLNYVSLAGMDQNEGMSTVTLQCAATGDSVSVNARCVVNATGVWANQLREGQASELQSIRPARGSHLVIARSRLPVDVSFTVLHPRDQRPIFVYPWLGKTVIGTTDLDTPMPGNEEIGITREELDYLFELAEYQFPGIGLTDSDVISTWAGIRPLVSSGASSSSGEKRDHTAWKDGRLISVSGGKLTTFRLIAHDVLKEAEEWIPSLGERDTKAAVFHSPQMTKPDALPDSQWQRLCGLYGRHALQIGSPCDMDLLAEIPGTEILWSELVWSAAHESVVHLDDLLLRRTRLGLLLNRGGLDLEDKLQHWLLPVLDWDDQRWHDEVRRYREIWARYYALPAN